MIPRRVTIADVARSAGVSKGAVSFALNGRPGVAPATRDRIFAAANELGWTPSHRARALAASRALAVGLVIARPPETLGSDPFFPGFIAGIESTLSPLGQSLLLQVVPDRERELAIYRALAADGRVDGVFLTDLRVEDLRPELLAEVGLPAVWIGPDCTDVSRPCVAVDDRPGIAAAVAHLVELGHRAIGHVAGPDEFVHGVSRRQAWEVALRERGLPAGPCVRADFSAQGGADATKALLDLPDPPTAIVYANDLMAIAGMAAVTARGLHVPVDVSITGFDDTEVTAHLQPPLTTVRTDAYAWGRAAAARLMAAVEGRPAANVALPPPHLVVRASTAPPPPTTLASSHRQETEKR